MLKFQVTDALNRQQTIHAQSIDEAVKQIERTGKRNVFGVEGPRSDKFYLDRGTGPLWPISVQAAAVELNMGGFKA
jgi:hypothetical protein